MSQYDRWLTALEPDYAQVDDRSEQQLLDFAVQFSRLIRFYDLQDQPDGDWLGFFLSDPLMVLALVSELDLTALQWRFCHCAEQVSHSKDLAEQLEALSGCFAVIGQLVSVLDSWWRGLLQSTDEPGITVFTSSLETAIRGQFAPQWRQLYAYALAASDAEVLNHPITLQSDGLSHEWSIHQVVADDSIYLGDHWADKISSALISVSALFDNFTALIHQLKLQGEQIASGLAGYGKHRPQIALYIAFARLFVYAQNSVNTLSSRYIRFYYDEVLRMAPQGAIADQLYLAFTLADDDQLSRATVPENTLFAAPPADNDQEVVYQAQNSLTVSAGKIAKLHTLQLESSIATDITADIATGEVGAAVTVGERIVASEILLEKTYSGDGLSWPTFGGSSPESAVVRPELAELGFAISSPCLWLTGGVRKVTLKIDLHRGSNCNGDSWQPLLASLAHQAGGEIDESVILLKLLEGAFELFATTDSGWFAIVDYGVTLDGGALDGGALDGGWRLHFTLDPSVPPLIPQAQDPVYGSAPTVKAVLKQQPVVINPMLAVYPLSVLSQMLVDNVTVSCEVSGLSDLLLSNTDGDIDSTAPFLVFGSTPVLGSYLQIYQQELFVKIPDTLTVTIDWFNLPSSEQGFMAYYRGYVIGPDGDVVFDNQCFRGDFSLQHQGRWRLPADPTDFLFRTEKAGVCQHSPPHKAKKLCQRTVFNPLTIHPAARVPAYYDPAQSAVRLTLTAPDYAFGNELYAQNVLNAVVKDLPDTDRCRQRCLDKYQGMQGLLTLLDKLLGSSDDNTLNEALVKQTLEDYLSIFAQRVMACLRDYLLAWHQQMTETEIENINALTVKCLQQYSDQQWPLDNQALSAAAKTAPDINDFRQLLAQYAEVGKIVEKAVAQSVGLQDLAAWLIETRDGLSADYDKKLTLCMEQCMVVKQPLQYPNDPWSPQAVAVSVNYTSQASLAKVADGNRYLHLMPFSGYREVEQTTQAFHLLPPFNAQGYLYIGLSDLQTPQLLTLLFHMSASSGVMLPPVQWAVLSDNHWQALSAAQIIADSSNNLHHGGIVALDLPAMDVANNTVLSADYSWLQVAVTQQAEQFAQTLAIYPHALRAQLTNVDSLADYTREALPAGSIDSPVDDLPDISSIVQPMASFGGRAPPTADEFKVATGERLRHKDRAILAWDYERLVLEQFADIWQVKALTASQGEVPGAVRVVVVPGPRYADNPNVTEPSVSNQSLLEIEQYLSQRASPFVTLQVCNPLYVTIEVTASVVFTNGQMQGNGIECLNSELISYLSPWFYDEARAASNGNYVNPADIAGFIQNLDYVAELLSMTVAYNPAISPATNPADEWIFLTSAAAHQISEVTHRHTGGDYA